MLNLRLIFGFTTFRHYKLLLEHYRMILMGAGKHHPLRSKYVFLQIKVQLLMPLPIHAVVQYVCEQH